MSEIDLPNDKAGKRAIRLEEAFFLVIASTTMVEMIPDYRSHFAIDRDLSNHAASAIGLARTLASEYELRESARRLGAVLVSFFDEEITEWFEEEVNTILREGGVDPENFEHFRPTREDMYAVTVLDSHQLLIEANQRGFVHFAAYLAPALRSRWEKGRSQGNPPTGQS